MASRGADASLKVAMAIQRAAVLHVQRMSSATPPTPGPSQSQGVLGPFALHVFCGGLLKRDCPLSGGAQQKVP